MQRRARVEQARAGVACSPRGRQAGKHEGRGRASQGREVEQARAAVEAAELNLSYTEITRQ